MRRAGVARLFAGAGLRLCASGARRAAGREPYLFSNSLPPAIVAAGIAVIERLPSTTKLRDKLERNTAWFRRR